MRRIVLALISFGIFFSVSVQASTSRHRSSGGRPYYGGGHHTKSHGGHYPGATNARHKNGHYQNWETSNRYGVHKR